MSKSFLFLFLDNRTYREIVHFKDRWKHIITWIDDKIKQLQILSDSQNRLTESYQTVEKWLEETTVVLKKMEAEPVSEIPKIMERIEKIKKIYEETQKKYEEIVQLTLEAEKLDDCELDGEAAAVLVSLETSQDKLDALKSILDVQILRIRQSGFEINLKNSKAEEILVEEKETPKESKKRKVASTLNDFETLASDLSSWLDCWETLLDQSDKNLENGEEFAEKHSKLCVEGETDLQNRRLDFEKALSFGQKAIQGIRNDKEKKQQKIKLLSSLTSRWNALEDRLKETKEEKEKLKRRESEKVLTEVKNLKRTVDDCRRWMEKATRKKIMDFFDEIYGKMESLVQGKDSVKELEKKLLLSSLDGADVCQSYYDLIGDFEMFFNEKINEYVRTLEDLMEDIGEQRLNDEATLEINIEEFSALEKTFSDHNEKLNKLNATGNFPQLMHIHSRWTEISNFIESKKKDLMADFEVLKKHNENLLAIENQIKAVEHWQNQELEEKDLDSYFQQYKGLMEKLNDLRSDLRISLENVVKFCSEDMKEFLTNEFVKILNKIDLLEEYHFDFKKAIDSFVNFNDYLDWLKDIEEECEKFAEVSDTSQLSRARASLVRLKEKVDSKNELFQNLQQKGDALWSTTELEVLKKKVCELSDRKSEVAKKVQDRHKQLDKASQQYGEFKALVAQESDWLDKLQRRLRKSPENAADAEDISEELDVRKRFKF